LKIFLARKKARACVEDIVSLIELNSENLSTKENLNETGLRLTKKIELVRSDLTRGIAGLKPDMNINMKSSMWKTGDLKSGLSLQCDIQHIYEIIFISLIFITSG